MRDEYIMEECVKEAIKGVLAGDGGPFGSIIIKDNRVVGVGHNRVIVNNDPTAHGEMEAIRDAGKTLGTFDLSGCVLYTSAEPCPMCASAIIWSNIKEVYYGCSVEDAEEIGFRDVMIYEWLSNKNEEILKMNQIGREAAMMAFKLWVHKEDKKQY